MGRGATGSSTVHKALRVLEALAGLVRQQPEGATLTELGRAAGFTASSTYRYLLPLISFGLVAQEPGNGHYRLGLRTVEWGGLCLQSLNLRTVARPFAEELTHRTLETVYLAVPDGEEVVYLDRIDSPLPLRPHTNLGGRNPLHCTALGKAMLAADPVLAARLEGRSLPARTSRTLTTPEALAAELVATGSRGYAVDDRENEAEVRCAGAAIRDHTGAVVGAISVSGPATRLTPERIRNEVGPLVRATAREISRAMGYALTGDGRGDTPGRDSRSETGALRRH